MRCDLYISIYIYRERDRETERDQTVLSGKKQDVRCRIQKYMHIEEDDIRYTRRLYENNI